MFTLFYSLLDLRRSECDVVCCSVNVSVCFVCCMLDSVCELFSETIRNVFSPYPEAVQGDKPTLVTHADLHPACGRLLE